MVRGIGLAVILIFLSCKESLKNRETKAVEKKEVIQNPLPSYPLVLEQVLNAPRGLERWKSFRNLSYVIPKGDIQETHTINLVTRRDRIDFSCDLALGFDGKKYG